MKTLLTLAILTGLLAVEALGAERELPIDNQLPRIGKDWIRRNDDGDNGEHSWVNFDNQKSAGEVLSFEAWKVSPLLKVTDSPVGQASIETFLHNGSAWRSSPRVRGRPISDTVRHRILSINLGTTESKRNIDAIEYTYVYEGGDDHEATMAHGYCLVIDHTVLFVQHTSPRAISSELAFDMAGGMLTKHFFQLTGKPHSISKGEILKTNE